MPDSKITALTSISTSTDPANDPLVIVDVSDTSMAATGTTKKVTLNQLLGASGTATLASATITGDLTVDTSTLKVDSANNRVGVGTASPSTSFHTNSDGVASGAGWTAIGRFNNVAQSKGIDIGYNPSNNNGVFTALTAGATSGFEWWSFDGSWSNRMTLNSTGLGVGTVPANGIKLAAYVTTDGAPATSGTTQTSGSLRIGAASTVGVMDMGTAGSYSWIQPCNSTNLATNYNLVLNPNGGNVGIGVTPSAWTGGRAIDLQLYGNLNTWDDGTAAQIQAGFNFYQTGSTFKYKISSLASMYRQRLGVHSWHTAPSGTADAAITWTQAMTLDASGNLLVRCTTAGAEQLGFQVIGYTNGNYVRINHNSSAVSGDSYLNFFYNAAQIGSITQNGTTGVLYNIISDYRLKEQVQPLIGGLARVNALKPSVYKWKSDGSNGEGFLAHELAEVVPFAVTGEKDAVNEDGSIKSQGIDMSRVVPILVAAIQELAAEVNALKNA